MLLTAGDWDYTLDFLYLHKLTVMKKILFLLFTLVTLASCRFTTGSGNIISETRSVKNFDGITVGGDFEVEVRIGPATSVVVEADDNIMEYIETTSSGSTLKIRTDDNRNMSDVHMKVYITTPSLIKVRSAASAEVVVQDIMVSTDKLTLKASSGSSIISELDAPEVEADVSSGASITISGKTKNYDAHASSGSDIRSWDLLSENTTVKVSSGAEAKVYASVSLNANASSGASITYHGAAVIKKSISSGASLTKKD